MKTVSLVFGTRPEAIKLAPVVLALRDAPTLRPHVCVTAQHREMLDQVLEVFGIEPDVDLDLMTHNQGLAAFAARALTALDEQFANDPPDIVLVQGDTTTVFTAALAAFYRGVPVGHVEAGLRTGNKHSPFPEEINRVLTTPLADIHFAPTEWCRDNLLRAGVPDDGIHVTGNTVIDALQLAVGMVREDPPDIPGLPGDVVADGDTPVVLITGHRRENLGEGFDSICAAIKALAASFPDVRFVYPVHRNPVVREHVYGTLDGLPNVLLIEPLAYLPFVALMDRSSVILTDSGGVQEEGPSLAKPVLVMRDTTERPEGVDAGTVRLVGTDRDRIVEEVSTLLTDPGAYEQMAQAANPYGDGQASGRIVSAVAEFLSG